MEETSQQEIYREYAEWFKKMSDEELVEAFNCQVGNAGWVARKITYLCALHAEFNNRNYDYSAIGTKGSLCLLRKIKLIGKKITPTT